MTNTTKRTLSLVLVIALIFSLGITALAVDPASLTFTPGAVNVYVGKTSATVTAPVNNYADYSGCTVLWSQTTAEGESSVQFVNNSTAVTSTGISTKVKGLTAGTAVTVTAKIMSADTTPVELASGTFTVTVNADTLASVAITSSPAANATDSKLYLAPDQTATLTLTGKLASDTAASSPKATWTTSAEGTVAVSTANAANSIQITALKAGEATITATSVDKKANGESATEEIAVVVKAAPEFTDPTADTTINKIVASGATVPLTVATNDGGDTYQWYAKKSTESTFKPVTSATGATYQAPFDVAGTTTYYCVASNGLTATSKTFTVAVKPEYELRFSSSTATVAKDGTLELSATLTKNSVSSNVPVSVNPSNETINWSDSDSAALPFVVTSLTGIADTTTSKTDANGVAKVTVKGVNVTTTTPVTVTAAFAGAEPATCKVTVTAAAAATPEFTSPTADKVYYVQAGATNFPALAVAVKAVDGNTRQYQWYSNTTKSTTGGTAISGATKETYAPNVSKAGTFYFYCKATNVCGTNGHDAYSKIFTVIVKDEYEIALTATPATVDASSTTANTTAIKAVVTKNTFDTTTYAAPTSAKVNSGSVTFASGSTTALSLSSTSAVNVATSGTTMGSASVTGTGKAESSGVKVTASYKIAGATALATANATAETTVVVKKTATPIALEATLTSFDGYSLSDLNAELIKQLRTAAGVSTVTLNSTVASGMAITFKSQTTTYGTLYTDDSENALKTTTGYYSCHATTTTANGTSTYYFHNMYFVPESTTTGGTYTLGFTVTYNSKDYAGTLTIKVPSNATTDIDISYNVKTSSTVTLDEQDFIDWYTAQFTSNAKDLYYVVFNDAVSGGTMKCGSTSLSTSTKYYVGAYAGTNDKLLSNLVYTAKTTVGSYKMGFTAYTKSGATAKTGTLYFCVTKAAVGDINYNVTYGTDTNLDEADFMAAYNTATGGTKTTTAFTIRFLEVPVNGTLYRGTETKANKISASQTQDYLINAAANSTSKYQVDDIIYVPANKTTGTETATYAAYYGGTLKFTGTVTFKYGTSTKTLSCGGEGYTFKASDFATSADKDPIVSVSFTLPTGGKLYTGYAHGVGTAVASTNKFDVAGTGTDVSISKLTYIPNAANQANTTISYTATTKGGKSVSGTIAMNFVKRTTAMKFNDVSDSWAIAPVDFCSQWGIVNGEGTGFNPNGTMQRGMLVTMIWRANGSPIVSTANPFKDVKTTDYFYNAVLWAYSAKIVTGTTAKTFSPAVSVSRQDIAVMLYRYASSPAVSTSYTASFADAGSISSYATNAMNWAVAQSIMSGSSNRLNPTATGTRAQVVAMLHRYLAK